MPSTFRASQKCCVSSGIMPVMALMVMILSNVAFVHSATATGRPSFIHDWCILEVQCMVDKALIR